MGLVSKIKAVLRRHGLNFCSTDHLGVDVEVDLARLQGDRPFKNIFDVGGNFGQSAIKFSRAFPEATILSFEPVPDSFQKLLENTAGISNIRAFNHGFGDKAGCFKIQLQPNAGGNSLLAAQSHQGAVEVRIETLDAFVSEKGINTIDLLKIDVEGFELQVLQGASEMLARGGVRHVFAECVFAADPVFPHTDFFELHRVLVGFGFCFVASYAESFRLADGCALGNVLYSLKSRLPARADGRIHNIY
jgi:FkbM family methyltransferase